MSQNILQRIGYVHAFTDMVIKKNIEESIKQDLK